MIYLIAIAVVVASIGFYQRFRVLGFLSSLLDTFIAAAFGWIAGLLIGVAARIGMWSIPFFNGRESHFTLDGTTRVVLAFSLYGIGIGVLYELVFRKLFRNRGTLFALFVTILAWYPLGLQGVQLLKFSPSVPATAFFTFLFIALMFVPYSIALEFLLGHWHKFHDASHDALIFHPK